MLPKGIQAPARLAPAGFDLYGEQPPAVAADVVDFVVFLAPVIKFARQTHQLDTHGKLEGPPAPLRIERRPEPGCQRHQHRACGQNLGAGGVHAISLGRIFLQGMNQKSAAVEFQVILDEIGMPRSCNCPSSLV